MREVALALGGKTGEAIARLLDMVVSQDTLLRRIQRSGLLVITAPRVSGVHDFA